MAAKQTFHCKQMSQTECGIQVLQEHAKVFEFNIAIVKQFDVGYRQYTSALLEFLPKWAYVAFILVIVAVLLKCCAPWTWHNM